MDDPAADAVKTPIGMLPKRSRTTNNNETRLFSNFLIIWVPPKMNIVLKYMITTDMRYALLIFFLPTVLPDVLYVLLSTISRTRPAAADSSDHRCDRVSGPSTV